MLSAMDSTGTSRSERRSYGIALAAFVAGALVSLLLGVYGAQHDPAFDSIATLGFGSMIEMKVALAAAVGGLAVVQLLTALWLYGKLRIRAPSWLGVGHRTLGGIAVLLSLPVAYHCLWSLGFQAGPATPTRVLVHSIA